MKAQNQQNPPLPKKKRVDSNGNSHMRLFAKTGTATMCIASGLTQNACDVLEAHIKGCIENLGGKSECSYLIIR